MCFRRKNVSDASFPIGNFLHRILIPSEEVRQPLIYQLLLLTTWILNRLPRAWALALGRLLGSLLYLVLPYRKDVAWHNLSRAFPNIPPHRRRAILNRTYQHFGMVMMDFVRMPAIAAECLGSIVDFDETHVWDAREQGGGAVIMSGHLGNWELTILSIGRWGYPMTTVVIRQRGPGGSFLEAVRNATGSRTISKKTPTRTMLDLLHEGNFLGMAGDQDARKRGVWVTFFGRPSSRPRGPAVFALRTGAPMLFCWCRLQRGRQYQLDFVPINTENLPRKWDQAVQSLTQRYMDILEEAIRRNPEQYFWFHRMWKTRPEPVEGTCPEPGRRTCLSKAEGTSRHAREPDRRH